MGMDITFKEKGVKENITLIELRGYDTYDVLSNSVDLPEIEYSKIDRDPEGYDVHWLSSKTIENYKTIVSILKDTDDPSCIGESLQSVIDKIKPIFDKDPNAKVYMEISF